MPARPARSPTRNALPARTRRGASAGGRSAWGWALAGALLGALPALAVFAPAQWLASAVASASGGQVQLAQVRSNAKSVPQEVHLVRSNATPPAGAAAAQWDGTLVLALPPR